MACNDTKDCNLNKLIKKSSYNIALVGATGAVGDVFLRIFEERNFPIGNIRLLASKRSVGKELIFRGQPYLVEELNADAFKDIDIAFFSAGAARAIEFAHIAVAAGAVVIDNSSAFRSDPDVPLVVPEVNPHDALKHKGIIANPNCTTILMVLPLKPLHDYAKIKQVFVASYQSTSGAGAAAMQELITQMKDWVNGNEIKAEVFPYQILFNVIPQVDGFTDNGYTKEEMKMFTETRKILNDEDIKVSATCVRVPILSAHSEAITIITDKKISVSKAIELLKQSKGIKILDDIDKKVYPMPLESSGQDLCYIGRVREDIAFENGLSFFISGDQLRKGAATNAIQIAELLIDTKY